MGRCRFGCTSSSKSANVWPHHSTAVARLSRTTLFSDLVPHSMEQQRQPGGAVCRQRGENHPGRVHGGGARPERGRVLRGAGRGHRGARRAQQRRVHVLWRAGGWADPKADRTQGPATSRIWQRAQGALTAGATPQAPPLPFRTLTSTPQHDPVPLPAGACGTCAHLPAAARRPGRAAGVAARVQRRRQHGERLGAARAAQLCERGGGRCAQCHRRWAAPPARWHARATHGRLHGGMDGMAACRPA